ncbi:MBL fold metallo-hydrolase [Serratia marcescens]|uniref:MBL fold metallo-hydrolase n=1 Tax=Serratia TaxID=613 RepID=UPI000E2A227F|nr:MULTISPECIES: MBL fold metallo-hydrolase [Serratia]KAB5499394.1 MBL fold metallo-hydrolase [Enterobacter sp. RJAL6]MBH2640280.1 MBL fold metallo-hydrolase [Serratia ureilytica]
MSLIKSFSVGNGDMFYIRHNTDNFTIIDCHINRDNAESIIADIKKQAADKGISRFISTHPDEDHFGGIELLDAAFKIYNFYVVKNKAIKAEETVSFKKYCELRDGDKAFYISKNCKRKWMNLSDEARKSAGLSILWPKIDNPHFTDALNASERGESYNNISAVVRYKLNDGASVMWLGDLETEFMENIVDDIELQETTVVFASHHGRDSGKIPNSWLDKIKPKVIIIGEAPSRHLHYYTGYKTITQNRAGDVTMECVGRKVHFYVSCENYQNDKFDNEYADNVELGRYIGSVNI